MTPQNKLYMTFCDHVKTMSPDEKERIVRAIALTLYGHVDDPENQKLIEYIASISDALQVCKIVKILEKKP